MTEQEARRAAIDAARTNMKPAAFVASAKFYDGRHWYPARTKREALDWGNFQRDYTYPGTFRIDTILL